MAEEAKRVESTPRTAYAVGADRVGVEELWCWVNRSSDLGTPAGSHSCWTGPSAQRLAQPCDTAPATRRTSELLSEGQPYFALAEANLAFECAVYKGLMSKC